MKTTLYDIKGVRKSEIILPKLFDNEIRQDIAQKYFEAAKSFQPYAHAEEAGKHHSASGTISHKRHDWKGHYGKGMSRVPRKTMSRRGTQFYWDAAEVSGMRGGRRSHGPRVISRVLKINKKEVELAMNSALAATASKELVVKRYSSIEKIEHVPAVIESLPSKTKDFFSSLKSIFGPAFSLVLQNKVVRAGKGKARGRKYKSNSGLLVVKASDEEQKFNGVDMKLASEIEISDLYPLGRLTLYTKKALDELSKEESR